MNIRLNMLPEHSAVLHISCWVFCYILSIFSALEFDTAFMFLTYEIQDDLPNW